MSRQGKIVIAVSTLILVGAVIAGSAESGKSKPKQPMPTATPSASPTPTLTPELPTPEPAPTVEEDNGKILVTKVIDGDTIEIEGGQKVRYIGIDTPETVHPSEPVGCFGQEASAKNKELVEGKSVKLEKDISETDKYGRLLRYVWVGDIFVNDFLVRQGYATSSTYPPDVKYQDQFREAEREARENNRGLWSACQTKPQTPAPTPTPAPASTPTPTPASKSGYTCDCSKTCSEMSSCEEAYYQLNECGCSARDGDDDGVPCESICPGG